MNPLRSGRDEWVGVGIASAVAGMTAYAIQRAVAEGLVRTKPVSPFRRVYNRADLETLTSRLEQIGTRNRSHEPQLIA